MRTLTCRRCGQPNERSASYCTNCGEVLEKPERGKPVPSTFTVREVDRTATGLLLLVIGSVLSAIPFINIIGAILALVAVILIYLGARAFGDRHRMYVVWSIVTWVLFFIATLAFIAFVSFQLARAIIEARPSEEMRPIWTSFVVGLGVISIPFLIPYLLITYQLQDAAGRSVLWAALVIDAAVIAGMSWYLYGQMEYFVDQVASGYGVGFAGLSFGGQLGWQSLVGLTNLVWAIAYYLPYRRIQRGELTPPGAPR